MSGVVGDLFLPLTRTAGDSLQAQLARHLRKLVDEGLLKPGTRLPGSRTLARRLRISRNTVVQVYDRLAAEGYLEQRPASGTFVHPRLSLSRPPQPTEKFRPAALRPLPARTIPPHELVNPYAGTAAADFWLGSVAACNFPKKSWSRSYVRAVAQGGELVARYTDPAGLPRLRALIAERLRLTRGITVAPDQVFICGGAQEAFHLIARLLIVPGTQVAIEDPGYAGAARVFVDHGAILAPIPIDEHGLRVEDLPATGPRLVYVTPSHQYPMGFLMTLERRRGLLAWARQAGAYIVEDDYDSDFRYDGPPLIALKGIDDEDLVIYVGTFSKALGPGLRLGFFVAPRALCVHFRHLMALSSHGRSRLEQWALAELLASGLFDRHLRRLYRLYRQRRDRLLAGLTRVLGPLKFTGTDGGLHFAAILSEHLPAASLWAARALARGVVLIDFARGAVHDAGCTAFASRTLLFNYAAVEEAAIAIALERLAELRMELEADSPLGR